MPTPCYIGIEGIVQGPITLGVSNRESVGNVYIEGHDDEILAQEIEHEVMVPTDPQSGQPSGQRVHKPFVFTSAINKATPLLYQALVNGEQLSEVEIRWYRTNGDGKQEHFFTTSLVDATIVNIKTILPHAQNIENQHYTQLIKVSMAYRKITWSHEISTTTGSDDWRKPVEAVG